MLDPKIEKYQREKEEKHKLSSLFSNLMKGHRTIEVTISGGKVEPADVIQVDIERNMFWVRYHSDNLFRKATRWVEGWGVEVPQEYDEKVKEDWTYIKDINVPEFDENSGNNL